MQDLRPFAGGVFGGGGWPAGQHQQHQQPAKCPRCESTNTKFCYYNNYNLAQPRHFCKACRRYWTKGGVLRNVPVGGGCRKSKRSSSSSSSSKATSQPSESAAAAPSDSPQHRRPRLLSFSSDSIGDVVSTAASAPSSSSVPVRDPTPPDPPFCPAPEIFPDPPATGLGFSDPPRAKAKAAPSVDQAVPADPSPRGGGTVPWAGGSLDPQLFDLASAVDPSAYWNPSHWMDADHTLYLP